MLLLKSDASLSSESGICAEAMHGGWTQFMQEIKYANFYHSSVKKLLI